MVHRYASLYFCLAVENQENELLALEVIHRYVELLDKYFGNVIHLVSPVSLSTHNANCYSVSVGLFNRISTVCLVFFNH